MLYNVHVSLYVFFNTDGIFISFLLMLVFLFMYNENHFSSPMNALPSKIFMKNLFFQNKSPLSTLHIFLHVTFFFRFNSFLFWLHHVHILIHVFEFWWTCFKIHTCISIISDNMYFLSAPIYMILIWIQVHLLLFIFVIIHV